MAVVVAVQTQIRQQAWQVVLAAAQDALAQPIPVGLGILPPQVPRKAAQAVITQAHLDSALVAAVAHRLLG